MWIVDVPELGMLTPADQLWIIAQAGEEAGGPLTLCPSTRCLAGRLEDAGWWLSEPVDPQERH